MADETPPTATPDPLGVGTFDFAGLIAALLPTLLSLIKSLFGMSRVAMTPDQKAQHDVLKAQVQTILDQLGRLKSAYGEIPPGTHIVSFDPSQIPAILADLQAAIPADIKLITDAIALFKTPPAPLPPTPPARP